ncbi:MAG: phosphonopyruvate decarboxylase [Nanoarchaeota archaeon]
MKPETLYQELKKQGFGPFTGVADSTFGGFFNYLESLNEYIPAPNEGLALSIASGSYLAGKKPVVLLQNAGIGNLINPQTSLNDLYKIKSLLLIGWRGNPAKQKDAPEHWLMGERTLDFLKLANIDSKVLESLKDISWANNKLQTMNTVALLINQGVIEEFDKGINSNYEMSRYDAIKIIADMTKGMIRFSTTAMASRELYELDESNKNFYTIGSMGHIGAIALGTALEKKERIIVIDGDGALLMHLGILSTIGNLKPKNLLHICLDNETYSSTGLQKTTSSTTDLEKIALNSGYQNSIGIKTREQLKVNLKYLLENEGPSFLHVKVNRGNKKDIKRIEISPENITKRFMEAIR